MAKEDKKVSRKRFDEIMGVAKSCIYQIRSAIGFFGFLISAILGIYIIIKFIRTEK